MMEILIGIAVVCFALVGVEIAGRGAAKAHEKYDAWITDQLEKKQRRRRASLSR